MQRTFIALRVEPDNINQLLDEQGNGLILNLAQPVDQYGPEWYLASHTLTITDQGVGLITFVFERRIT